MKAEPASPPPPRRPSVLFVQPSLNPPGGGHGVAAWMLEGLQGDHDISVLCWAAPDKELINRFYGTSLDWTRICVQHPPASWRRLFARVPIPLALLRDGLLLARARALSPRYDVTIGANNECDFGRPGIQYVHFPKLLSRRPNVDLNWYSRPKWIRNAYRWSSLHATGFSVARMRRNLTLCNSDWTKALLERELGIDAVTLNPPVAMEPRGDPWRQRQDGMLCVGRISPEKRLDLVIDLFLRLCDAGMGTHLYLIGSPNDDEYTRHIRSRVAAHRDRITLMTDLTHNELAQLMMRNRWGIQGMLEEHFGMAIAEMLRAGMVVFCPNQGGQVEIMGRDERLLYRDLDDAVQKVSRAFYDEQYRESLREYLRARAELFSVQRFKQEICDIVSAFMAENRGDQIAPQVAGLRDGPDRSRGGANT